jgi:hypothetical protein
MVLAQAPLYAHTLETGINDQGFALPLRLLDLAGPVAGAGAVTPMPEPVRRRDRSG